MFASLDPECKMNMFESLLVYTVANTNSQPHKPTPADRTHALNRSGPRTRTLAIIAHWNKCVPTNCINGLKHVQKLVFSILRCDRILTRQDQSVKPSVTIMHVWMRETYPQVEMDMVDVHTSLTLYGSLELLTSYLSMISERHHRVASRNSLHNAFHNALHNNSLKVSIPCNPCSPVFISARFSISMNADSGSFMSNQVHSRNNNIHLSRRMHRTKLPTYLRKARLPLQAVFPIFTSLPFSTSAKLSAFDILSVALPNPEIRDIQRY